jgi:catechol 2,3-dioxygenase-like lactoylglutathione lyase family enzyme
MPAITRILETALYVDDIATVTAFYRDILGLRVLERSARLVALDAGHATILLLFQRGATLSGFDTPGGRIPPHDARGPAHFAFAIESDSLPDWEAHLERQGILVESRVEWPGGGRSLYFRDPAGHSVELATPGTWAVY